MTHFNHRIIALGLLISSFVLVIPKGTPGQIRADEASTLPVSPTESAISPTDIPSIIANKQWTPQIQSYNGVDMALVPPGCVTMALTQSDITFLNNTHGTGYFSNSGPPAKICFLEPFWIDKYLVTNQQFNQFNGKAATSSHWTGDQRPRESITWFESRDFCALRGARLPTEAEWEYAARGPDNLAFPWGNDFSAANAVYADNSNSQTADVGSKPGGASWVGALDMAGDVWEWTTTIYQSYPYQAGDGRENMNDLASDRDLRGGSWDYVADYLRSGVRIFAPPEWYNIIFGFRCARDFGSG